ncbi:PilT/PilU family type 4a pilus ATPase [Candidatus Dojkabacteria bacterium]|nr:PilT/PilU family type 4a pilus ATPase [Candidatus Dojkabacteria bacterium]
MLEVESKGESEVLTIAEYAKICLEKNSSDLHFTAGYPVYYRIDGSLVRHSADKLTARQTKELLYSILSEEQKNKVEEGSELDFMYVDPRENRFRVNIYKERGNLAGAFRSIPKKVRTIDELGLPPILKEFSKIPYGLVLVTGPTGSGKSTSIAAMIEEINRREPRHIITIEDPVEYVYDQKVALIAQRTMHEDTESWHDALRSALRQDPDVVLVGEMRDYETIASALTIAETGHLVFATLHTNSAAQTVDRIIDVFPGDQQNQVRTQLGNMLSGVISQRLVPLKNGGRKAAMEVLIASNAVKSAIREGKTHQIDNMIQTSADIGMFTLEKSLVDMIRMGEIDIDTAKNFTIKPDQIDLLLK